MHHRVEFSHPGDPDYDDTDLPECPYGTACYRKNKQHWLDFSHTTKPRQAKRPQQYSKLYLCTVYCCSVISCSYIVCIWYWIDPQKHCTDCSGYFVSSCKLVIAFCECDKIGGVEVITCLYMLCQADM
jgi:hypothetical protein